MYMQLPVKSSPPEKTIRIRAICRERGGWRGEGSIEEEDTGRGEGEGGTHARNYHNRQRRHKEERRTGRLTGNASAPSSFDMLGSM